jgi:hypothetical protein
MSHKCAQNIRELNGDHVFEKNDLGMKKVRRYRANTIEK